MTKPSQTVFYSPDRRTMIIVTELEGDAVQMDTYIQGPPAPGPGDAGPPYLLVTSHVYDFGLMEAGVLIEEVSN